MKQQCGHGGVRSPLYTLLLERVLAVHTTTGIEDGRRKRRPIRRIVIAAILLVALIEPLVMYRALTHERAARRAVADSALANPVIDAGDGSSH